MNELFNLKIRELTCLKKNFQILDNGALIELNENGTINIIGCEKCYMILPTQDHKGYSLPTGRLMNYSEIFNTVADNILLNCWFCPHCNRLFKELMIK